MLKNVGKTDRAIRLIVGPAIFLVAFMAFESTFWMVLFALIGIVVFLTGLFRGCLLYLPFKKNTDKADKSQTETQS